MPCSYPKLTKVPASKSPEGPTPTLGSGTGSAGTVGMGPPGHLPRDPSPSLALRRPAVFRASRLFLGISPACDFGRGGEPGAGGSSHFPPPHTLPRIKGCQLAGLGGCWLLTEPLLFGPCRCFRLQAGSQRLLLPRAGAGEGAGEGLGGNRGAGVGVSQGQSRNRPATKPPRC